MLIEVLALSLALLGGVRWWQLLLLALAVFAPAVLVPPIIYTVLLDRRPPSDRAPLFCDVVASELRGGATLRFALLRAADSTSIDLDRSASGASVGEIARAVASRLPRLGAELEATVEAVGRSGGAAADLFDELAAYAISHDEIVREVRVATAPARATAWFFLIAPAGFVAYQLFQGTMTQLFVEPEQMIPGVAGALLFVVGITWMMTLVRRAG